MMIFLRATQVLALILSIISTPLVILGFGLLIVIPLLAFVIMANRAAEALKDMTAMTRGDYRKYNISVVAASLACIFALFAAGTLANVDTTGKPGSTAMIVGFCVAAGFATALLFIGHHAQKRSG